MAPSLKEVESPAANTATSSPATPQSKPAGEAPARPQPVALEIPVTINGARTVDGSDKRVPFSESTQTVLVFPHGAVIRIATPLTSGQLVFLTNEKTKKEVVCQVVKSKSSGGTGAYVELQFTEPSLGFWGLQIPGGSVTPSTPRPVAPSTTAANKPAAQADSISVKPAVIAKPIAPTPVSTPPAKPPVPTPAPSAALPPAPANVAPPAPVAIKQPTVVLAPEALKPATPVVDSSSKGSTVPEKPAPIGHSTNQVSPLHDYSKQIDALFAGPKAPPAPPAAELPVSPSTDDLKLQAARLQEQLSSLLFTEKPPVSPAPPSSALVVTPEMMANDLSAKLADLIQGGPAAAPKEPKTVVPIRKPASTPLAAEEDVKIPSWLGSIENAEVVIESDSAKAAADHSVSVHSEESFDALVADTSAHPQTAVAGGQLLGESAAPATEATAKGSKKGLFIGLAAAGLLVVGGGAWYYSQSRSNSSAASTHVSSIQPAAEPAPASNAPEAPVASTPALSNLNSSPSSTSPKPSTNSTPIPATTPAVSAPPPKNSNSASREDEQVKVPAKSSLKGVHLAAPVVNHTADSQTDSDAFADIDTKSAPSGADPLATVGIRHNGPAAPLPVGGDVKQAQLIKSVAPEYPIIAKTQHVSGTVQIEAVVDTSGNVAAVKIVSGPALLRQAALDAVKKWKYSPAILDGQPTITHVIVNVDFRNQ
jgi:TonB family protein